MVANFSHCNPFEGDLLVINPGNLVDSLVILQIKRDKFTQEEAGGYIQDEICRTAILLGTILDAFPAEVETSLQTLTDELRTINLVQWDLEDRVRKECSWEAAQAARMQNNKRVSVKNKINQLFNYPCEVKKYT